MQFIQIFHVCLIPLILLLRLCSSTRTLISASLPTGNFSTEERLLDSRKTYGAKNITTFELATPGTSTEPRVVQHDSPIIDYHVEKDTSDPSTLLNVYLSQKPTLFKQYFVKLIDISPELEVMERDSNRTFLPSPPESKVISVRGLHPGHQYSVSIVGRKDGESVLLKEQTVTMDPVAPDFYSHNATILPSFNNITLRALKPDNALQEKFRVKYFQVEPNKTYPPLEVYDIIEQKHIEIYIGNLNPGRDYNVSVISFINGMDSKPWTGILTTKPLTPSKLRITDSNSSCISLSWDLPPSSGVDRFFIQYDDHNESARLIKLYTQNHERSTTICELKPGHTFTFGIKTEKGKETSELSLLEHTLRPKPPENLKVTVDYNKRKFLLSLSIPPESETYADGCNISIASERLDEIELSAAVEPSRTMDSPRKCLFYATLHPGYRYEIAAVTISKNTKSVKLAKNFALEPGFDMKQFELNLQETNRGLQLEWPRLTSAFAKVESIWADVVGNDSTLHLNLEPQSKLTNWKEQPQKFVIHLNQKESLVVPNLTSGACYKVQIYTVTKSGIVSADRFEEYIRISAPLINITTDEVTKNSARFRFTLPNSMEFDSSECFVNVVVFDMHSIAIYNRTLPLTIEIAPVLLQGLRPYHKYTINSQIICGRSPEQLCSPRMRTLHQLTFETRQDRPGPVQNLTVRPLNPYSVQLSWMPPALPNGVITHYIARVHPMEDSESEWSVSVGATPQHLDHVVNGIIDNLIGGLAYRMDVRAVTEAGEGNLSAVSDAVLVLMPILPPPQPTSRIEILHNTVRSNDVTVRYSTAMFSTKHGLLIKSAIIVVEVTDDGKTNEFWAWEHRNSTPTWREVQVFDVWPPYVAVETPIEPIRKFFPPRSISEVIGVDSSCDDVDAEYICNGALKPGSNYKFKLRLYTAPNLWTDTEYSEIITTGC